MPTQLVNAQIGRVDAVDEPATGLPFLMFKSANTPKENTMPDAVTKAENVSVDESVEDLEADSPEVDGKSITPENNADVNTPGSATWEAVDAANARTAVSGLLALRELVNLLASREAAEGDDSDAEWNLQDAASAIDCALAELAKFAVDEQGEADTAAADAEASARAAGLMKSLTSVTKADGDPAPAPAAPAPAAEPANADDSLSANTEGAAVLPSGLKELLDEFVSAYAALAAKDNEAAPADDDAVSAAPAPEAAPATPAAPVADAAAPAAPLAAPALEGKAPAPGAGDAPAAAPAAPAEEPKPEDVAKSMEDRIKVAVASAVAEAVTKSTTPLIERIDTLEKTPQPSGAFFAGQTPGNGDAQLRVRGMTEGVVAKGLQSAAAQAEPSMNALTSGLKGIWNGAQ